MKSVRKVLLSTTISLLLGVIFTGTAYADEVKTGTVIASELNVRSGPSLSNKINSKVYQGKILELVDSTSNWYKVRATGVSVGWVSKRYIKTAGSVTPRETALSDRGSSGYNLQDKLVSYAQTFIGVPYVWGGTSPRGFDCSGFVQYVYSHFGYSLERVSSDQSTQGVAVSKSQLQPGDLVFFDSNGTASRINHVGMYIGDGQFLQASSSRGITISDLTSNYYAKRFMKARRILN